MKKADKLQTELSAIQEALNMLAKAQAALDERAAQKKNRRKKQ